MALRFQIIFLFSVLLIHVVGCGRGNDSKSMIANANDSNVKRLATMYSFFHLRKNMKGPVDESEFIVFIEEQDAKRLALAGVDTTKMEQLFVSERDGEPFRIRYGMDTYIRGPSLPVIFETEGVDGLRQVGFTNGSMKEVDQEEYDRLFSGKADKEEIEDGRQ